MKSIYRAHGQWIIDSHLTPEEVAKQFANEMGELEGRLKSLKRDQLNHDLSGLLAIRGVMEYLGQLAMKGTSNGYRDEPVNQKFEEVQREERERRARRLYQEFVAQLKGQDKSSIPEQLPRGESMYDLNEKYLPGELTKRSPLFTEIVGESVIIYEKKQ